MLATLPPLCTSSVLPLQLLLGGDESVLKKLSLKERFFGFHFAAAADDILYKQYVSYDYSLIKALGQIICGVGFMYKILFPLFFMLSAVGSMLIAYALCCHSPPIEYLLEYIIYQ